MNYYKHHIFFCLNQREDGEACCSDKGAESMFMYMKAKIKSFDLNGESKVRINRAGCFDRCGEGPLRNGRRGGDLFCQREEFNFFFSIYFCLLNRLGADL